MPDAEKYPEPLSQEEVKARGSRNLVLALSLVGFIVLVFVVSIVRMQDNMKHEAEKTARSGDEITIVEEAGTDE